MVDFQKDIFFFTLTIVVHGVLLKFYLKCRLTLNTFSLCGHISFIINFMPPSSARE